MSANILLVKNMVCHRCLMAVENILMKAAIPFQKVTVGEIHLVQALSDEQDTSVRFGLAAIGLELIDNRTSGLIEKIKQLVIKRARNEVDEKEGKMNLSLYLSKNLYQRIHIPE